MIISRMNFEFPNAPWATPAKPGDGARRVFKQIATKARRELHPVHELEHMSLGELFYMIMMNEEAAV